MHDVEPPGCHVGDRAGQHQASAGAATLGDVLEEGRLVRKGVPLVAREVVEPEQVVVEEAGRPGRGHDEGWVQDFDVAERAGELGDPLLVAEDLLGVVGIVVDHRIPDGARELQERGVQRAAREQPVRLGRPRVVHVEDADLAVVDHERRVADRAVGRGDERVDREGQRPGLERLEIDALDEPREPERPKLLLEVVERVGREQHRRVLVDVVAQVARVEMVVVEVRDVEIRRVPDALGIDAVVGREREPRAEERGVEPGVAQDADALRFHEEARLAEERDLHPGRIAARPRRRPRRRGRLPRACPTMDGHRQRRRFVDRAHRLRDRG